MIYIVCGIIAFLVLYAATELIGTKGYYKNSGREDED